MERTLLLVDDEENITSALTRLLRREGYQILRANSGQQGLEILTQNQVGVIVSDQRMPEMTGTEFLSRVRELYPDTIRIVLSGYTELNSVTDAINRGNIYKFLTKPWDDDLLRENIEEAFRRYEMKIENARMARELVSVNEIMAQLNANLKHMVELKTREAGLTLGILNVAQEVLNHLPLAVIGIGEDGLIAMANRRAEDWFGNRGGSHLLGEEAAAFVPVELLGAGTDANHDLPRAIGFELADGRHGRCWRYTLGESSGALGVVLVVDMHPQEMDAGS